MVRIDGFHNVLWGVVIPGMLVISCWSVAAGNQTQYVGSETCGQCHNQAFEHWQGSHHQLAMTPASQETVLGQFDNLEFEQGEHKARFFRKNEEFWIRFGDDQRKAEEHQVLYTFGVEPLQQYLVPLPGGRLQFIPYAWDSRPKEQGGQRWFHLYPELTPEDEFYWTNQGQNWNTMCADCHTTAYEKNYDPETNSYQPAYAELAIGCEACHGPGAEHSNWAKQEGQTKTDPGFSRQLNKSVSHWLASAKTATPGERQESDQLDTCAQCHSRRLQMSEGHKTGDLAFHHNYLINLVDSLRYYPDGQVADENFVMGSFMQSKMHAAGVVCSDCHQPHSAELQMPEPILCTRCHQAEVFDTPSHHHHESDSEGALCSNCHMPTTTFMQVDDRKAHSFRVPRGDFATTLRTPLVCSQCHQDKSVAWAVDHLNLWNPKQQNKDERHFAPAFAAAEQGQSQGLSALSYVAQDVTQPDIIRASALARLSGAQGRNPMVALARASRSDSDMLLFGAIAGSDGLQPGQRWSLLSPLLSNDNPLVRAQAASALATQYQQLSENQRQQLQPALADYERVAGYNADRGFGLNNLANLARLMGDMNKAESLYRKAIKVEPIFEHSYVNLAALKRESNQPEQEAGILKKGREVLPGSALLAHQYGLMAIRQGQQQQALSALAEATELAPANSQYGYVYALALEPNQPALAVKQLVKVYQQSNDPRYLYSACEIGLRNRLPGSHGCLMQLEKVVQKSVVDDLRQRYSQ